MTGINQNKDYYGLIYLTTNLVNNKIYIGQTTKIEKWKNGEYKGSGSLIFTAIKKYGIKNFKSDLICYCPHKLTHKESQKELDNLEIFYIKEFNSLCPKGYNLGLGGSGVGKHSKESKEKMSKFNSNKIVVKDKEGKIFKIDKNDSRYTSSELIGVNKGIKFKNVESFKNLIQAKNPITGEKFRIKKDDPRWLSGELVGTNKGKVVSQETKEKISKATVGKIISKFTKNKLSKAAKGKVVSQETKEKISKALIGSCLSQETKEKISKSNRGKSHAISQETKEKISKATKGRVAWNKGKSMSGNK